MKLNFAHSLPSSPSSSQTDAILNLELNAYGISAVNTTLNLCELLNGVLCPLPQYDFVGSATIPLPAAVTDSINIPGIGFLIPDLEATAFGTLSLTLSSIQDHELTFSTENSAVITSWR